MNILMKKIFSIFILHFLIFSSISFSQTVSLTFRVDMSQESVSANGVHVAGNFQAAAGFGSDWNPGVSAMTDGDGDDVYELTVSVPAGTYLYKFVNGNNWSDKPELPPAECALSDGGGNNNREVTVGANGLSLPPIPFDSCNAVLQLAVNMSQEQVSPNGVHVMGDFQAAAGMATNWDPASLQLEDENGDGTYEISISVVPGNYQYVFVNGNSSSDQEILTSDCAKDDGNGNFYRRVAATRGTNSPSIYCFGTCTPCDPSVSDAYDTYWWNDAVFYEIFVRSFYDSDGDGIGDFQGLIQKLDYLNDGDPSTDDDLGITGIWLMPMMESPSYHGYDVTDYYATEPDYGTMADFEELLDSCHARGIKVIIDFVMNHSSDQHPWFSQSANSQNNYRDWYIWSNNDPGFLGPWGQGVWHNRNGAWYYGLFWGGMPDLNYSHQPVRDEMFDITRFWLDKGVDGFRLDAIKYLDEDGTVLENTPETFSLLEEFNQVYKTKNPEAFTVGEVWSSTSSILPYVQNDRLDVCFDFDLAYSMINAVNQGNPAFVRSHMDVVQQGYARLQYATFLTNHDIDRIFSQFGEDDSKMKLAASIYLSLPGIPFIYYGEELGMTGTGIHENIRRPMQWSGSSNAGFSSTSPWYGLGSNYQSRNVANLAADQNSLLSHYKKWIHLRNEHEALKKGYLLDVESNVSNQLLSFARVYGSEAVVFHANMGTSPLSNVQLELPISSLMPGKYAVVDLTSGQVLDSLDIDPMGGFSGWSPQASLAARESRAILISNSLSVNKEKVEDGLVAKVFPNPSKGMLKVELGGSATEKTVILVYNVEGQPVFRTETREKEARLGLSHLSGGLYFVALHTEQASKMLKIEILP